MFLSPFCFLGCQPGFLFSINSYEERNDGGDAADDTQHYRKKFIEGGGGEIFVSLVFFLSQGITGVARSSGPMDKEQRGASTNRFILVGGPWTLSTLSTRLLHPCRGFAGLANGFKVDIWGFSLCMHIVCVCICVCVNS